MQVSVATSEAVSSVGQRSTESRPRCCCSYTRVPYARGGASCSDVLEVDDDIEESILPDAAFGLAEVPSSDISQLADMTKALSQEDIEGAIGGVHHIAAWTCGDLSLIHI